MSDITDLQLAKELGDLLLDVSPDLTDQPCAYDEEECQDPLDSDACEFCRGRFLYSELDRRCYG